MREPNASATDARSPSRKQPGIDEDADHPRPERFGQQGRADGRIDPS